MWMAIEVRKHPNLDVYASSHGYLLYDDGELVSEVFQENSYRRAHIDGTLLFTHVVVAEAWHDNPDKKPVVNHIDGNKKNCRPSNLEWATYSDNLNHAYEAGLRTDNNVTYVRDIRTDDVTSYVSQSRAAKALGSSGPALCAYLKSERTAPFLRYYEIRYDTEWRFTLEDTRKYRKSDRKRVVVVLENGDVVVYPQIPAFIKAMVPELLYATAYQRLVNGTFKKLTGIDAVLEFDYTGSLENATFIEDKTKATIIRPIRQPRRVKITYTRNGETVVKEYSSLREFCKEHSFGLVSVQKAVWAKGFYRNYHIAYIG